jgi:hypothetical protein
MIKVNGLRKYINKRVKIAQLIERDFEQYVKVIRREGIILTDSQFKSNDKFHHITYYYHSGYICNVHLINGDIDSCSIKCYDFFTWPQIKAKLKELNLVDSSDKIIKEL